MSIAAIWFATGGIPPYHLPAGRPGGHGESCQPVLCPAPRTRTPGEPHIMPNDDSAQPDEVSAPKPGHFLPGGAGGDSSPGGGGGSAPKPGHFLPGGAGMDSSAGPRKPVVPGDSA